MIESDIGQHLSKKWMELDSSTRHVLGRKAHKEAAEMLRLVWTVDYLKERLADAEDKIADLSAVVDSM